MHLGIIKITYNRTENNGTDCKRHKFDMSTVGTSSSCSCGSVVEHCVSSAKGCGFNSQGTHVLTKIYIACMHCKSLWIKASAKCINVNVVAKM